MSPSTQTMTETETTPKPRRSGRDKKQAERFVLGASSNKRKRNEDTDGDEMMSAAESEPEKGDETADEDDYVAPKKTKATSKGKGKARGPVAPKKPRATKATPKTTTRKGKQKEGGDAFDPNKAFAESKIANDNGLFNAIMNPSAALQGTVEDFLESLSESPEAALADLINCILRACGSNDSVDSYRAVDYDGVVDALDDFTEVLKEDNSPTYPLTSKLPAFKKFRKSLSEFLHRLVTSSAELATLYTSDLLPTLQTWVVAMSSSQLRSFRHTATVIALELETALCDVAAAVEKEAEVITRQREGERKRKGKASGAGRDKEFEGKAAEVKERRTKMQEFLKEYFDGVFVHRYRDLDPNIRAECVHAMGNWLKKFPAHFLDGQYLRYIGWVLSDANTHVRLEAVRALVSLYVKEDFIVSLHHFTERFKPRLIEMATGDTDLGVRVAVIQALSAIDAHGLLEEDQREKLCLLVFDEEAKVRKAVSSFVKGVWEETVEQRLVGKKAGTEEKDRAGVKALALLLVKWTRALDTNADTAVEDGENGESQNDTPSRVNPHQKGGIALAVEALWEDVETVSDWQAMIDLLLLDHSAGGTGNGAAAVSSKRKQKKTADDAVVDEAWRLEEVEETVLLEVLTVALRKSKTEATGGKKGAEDAVASEITRALIKSLPSLFTKHQTDESRIADVLLIPEIMNLEMYLEMRMITAYEALWDDITKQFLSHSTPTVLSHAMSAIRHLMSATSLSNTNSAKILELEDELSSSLRDAVARRDELEVASFTEDEALSLGAICARLVTLSGTRDMTTWMEEDEGGKQSSAWDIICALAERGRLGYKEEELMVERALHQLTLHIIWKARSFVAGVEEADRERLLEALREQRDILLEKLTEYAIGTQSNAIEGVKRAAFQHLMTLYSLFCPASTTGPDGTQLPLAPLALTMDDEVQYRCAGFVQAEIERYAEDMEGERPHRDTGSGDESQFGSGSELEEDGDAAKAKKGKGKDRAKGKMQESDDDRLLPRSKLEQEYVLNTTVATFLRAIRVGAVDVKHGAVLLTHYGRIGSAFDISVRVVVDSLREEGMHKDNGALVATVITRALQDSFTLYLDAMVDNDTHTLALSKLLASCLLIRGAQLAIVKRLESDHVVDIHTNSTTWITKVIAGYETNGNKKGRTKAVLFFRVLLQLLVAIQSRDALKIKAHLDQNIAQNKIEVSATSKSWEPYRAYEKRLTTAGSKEKGKKGRGKANQTDDAVTTDDDEEMEVHGLVTNASQFTQPTQTTMPTGTQPSQRPRPRPAYRSKNAVSENEASDVESRPGDDNVDGLSAPPSPPVRNSATPAKSRKTNGRTSPAKLPSVGGSQSPTHSQTSPRKRSHPATDTEEDDLYVREDGVNGNTVDDDATLATQSSEIIVRRKRVRH
ncbi:hypothetical protein BD410DRAFT_773910 [Rickenella mellea]|uniref:SCD domain-containing protein n=1 Tax=Rickenella mellea TaxID=50990 RepID=A0A4Y7PVP3_9AGAM|nr:hypothetical protein BD410DRAFT_773910 [Rickenella mellea]